MTSKLSLIASAILAFGLGACAQVDTRVDTHCQPAGAACAGGPSTGAVLDSRPAARVDKSRPTTGRTTAAAAHSGGRTFFAPGSVKVDAQGRMLPRSAAPIPTELNKPVVCADPHCAPIKPVMPVGGTRLMHSTPTTTMVEKRETIDCARTPGCTRGTNPVTRMSAGFVDNGPFDPHAFLRGEKN